MKQIAQAALDALEEGTARIGGAVEILADEPVRLWNGFGVLTLEGVDYQPLGRADVGIATGAAIGGIAQNTTLTLSGIDPEAIALLDATGLRRAPVTVRSLVFDGSGTQLLDAFVHRRGRVDRVIVREASGGTASITLEVESPGRGLGRRTGRIRSDADQRLIDPSDGGLSRVSYAGEKQLYWGGRRPAKAGQALGAVSTLLRNGATVLRRSER